MMKKLIALTAAVAFVFFLPTLAAAKGTKTAAPHVTGAITAWNEAAKAFTIKDAAGKEHTFAWNEKTKVTGTPKVGEHAKVAYTKDKYGKVWATEVHVGAASEPTRAAAKK